PPADQPRLLYRLGKVWLQSDRDLPRAIAYLERALLQGPDDAAEGFSLLAQAYLRLPAPNLEGALPANLKLLALPTLDEDVLGPARLQCGDLFLRLHRPAEARKILENIGAGAPRDVRYQGRTLQARACQDLRLWDEAVRVWQEVLKDTQGRARG